MLGRFDLGRKLALNWTPALVWAWGFVACQLPFDLQSLRDVQIYGDERMLGLLSFCMYVSFLLRYEAGSVNWSLIKVCNYCVLAMEHSTRGTWQYMRLCPRGK